MINGYHRRELLAFHFSHNRLTENIPFTACLCVENFSILEFKFQILIVE